MMKSLREAKRHSNWASPNAGYEGATMALVRDALASRRFLEAFEPFQHRVARLGAAASLVQTALKLTVPGVPDIYQGAEMWDFSLVDPDNRRPVDHEARALALEEVSTALAQGALPAEPDGRLKLALTAALLADRKARPGLYAHGDYQPLLARGPGGDAVVAFTRRHGGEAVFLVARRFPADLDWQETILPSPGGGTWRNILTGRPLSPDSALRVADALDGMPVGVFATGD